MMHLTYLSLQLLSFNAVEASILRAMVAGAASGVVAGPSDDHL